ncbi:MAG: hypothetical protein AB7K09_17015 [Planctomycetota bacterium]
MSQIPPGADAERISRSIRLARRVAGEAPVLWQRIALSASVGLAAGFFGMVAFALVVAPLSWSPVVQVLILAGGAMCGLTAGWLVAHDLRQRGRRALAHPVAVMEDDDASVHTPAERRYEAPPARWRWLDAVLAGAIAAVGVFSLTAVVLLQRATGLQTGLPWVALAAVVAGLAVGAMVARRTRTGARS